MSSVLFSLGKWAMTSRRFVMVGWLISLLALGGLALATNQGLDRDVTIPGTESQDALDSLARTFPEVSGTSAQIVVVAAQSDAVDDEAYVSAIAGTVAKLERLAQVEAVVSPFADDVVGVVSEDGRAAIIQVQMTGDLGSITTDTERQLAEESANLNTALPAGAQTFLGGQLFSIVLPSLTATELVGVAVALIVLVVTFGSLLAAGMPLVVAVVGVGLSTALIFIGTAFTAINSTTPVLSLMLGLAVGIDYSLFIISRHREQLQRGVSVSESIPRAVATSGSAVVFAGVTVIVALLGLSVAGIPFLTTMGVAAAIGVGMAVVMSTTLLPAMMGAAGDRLAPKRRSGIKPRKRTSSSTAPSLADRFYRGWVRGATRYPVVTVLAAVVLLGAATVPALSLRLALPDAGTLPEGNEARQTYDLITEHFGEGHNAALIVTGSVLDSDDPVQLMNELGSEIAALEGVAAVPLATPNAAGDTGIVQVIPSGSPTSAGTNDLVVELRDLRDHFYDTYGIETSVTGQTAVQIDVSDKLGAALVPFGLLVVGLCFILLMMVFRSIWVPIKAALGYLLSLGAAFGAVALVFEHGVFADALHVTSLGPVISFMPIIVMGILFGLAMDYELFLVSRIREEHVHGASADSAIERGFMGSARVVTAAALIMFAVFAAFVPEGDSTMKPMALALAVGVFVDAFIVRMTLVPAVLKLLGERAWWMPRWLDQRLPSVDVEGEAIAHELALADWPEPHSNAIIAAADVSATTASTNGAPTWNARVGRGDTHVIVSDDPVAATSILLTATGRLRAGSGRLKVMGQVLPARSGAVRTRTNYLALAEHDDPIGASLQMTRDGSSIIAIDDIDTIPERERRKVIDVLKGRPEHITVLLATNDSALARHMPLASTSTLTVPAPAAQEHLA